MSITRNARITFERGGNGASGVWLDDIKIPGVRAVSCRFEVGAPAVVSIECYAERVDIDADGAEVLARLIEATKSEEGTAEA